MTEELTHNPDSLAMNGTDIWYYLGEGNEINTRAAGVDYGGKIERVFDASGIQVWRKAGSTGWSGVGERSYYPAAYWLVDAGPDWREEPRARKFAHVILGIVPGRNRRLRDAIIDRARELAADPALKRRGGTYRITG